MKGMYYLRSSMIIAMLLRELETQQQLIEAQQQLTETQRQLAEAHRQVIETQKQMAALQRKMTKMTPKTPKDKDVFWHLVSDGLSSESAATSDDLLTVEQFDEWVTKFGEKHIKPYVHPKVYSECINQMTRGLPRRLAELEALAMFSNKNGKHPPSYLRDN